MKPIATHDDMPAQLRRKNVRLALILASVVAVFFVGFIIKVIVLGAPR